MEDETHVLTNCPLYSPIGTKFDFYPDGLNELAGLLSDSNLTPNKITSIARVVHAILSTNENNTAYYKSPDFHSNTGDCILI